MAARTRIEGREQIERILAAAPAVRVAMCAAGEPYVVPLSFGYRDGCLYFHSGPRGRKLEILRENPRVCFQLDTGVEKVPAEGACGFSMRYESVIGRGRAVFLETDEEKAEGLRIISEHYGAPRGEFRPDAVRRAVVVRVDIDELTAKKSD